MKLTRKWILNHAKHNLPPFIAGYVAREFIQPNELVKLILSTMGLTA